MQPNPLIPDQSSIKIMILFSKQKKLRSLEKRTQKIVQEPTCLSFEFDFEELKSLRRE